MLFFIVSLILAGREVASGTELVPERYLRPRNFNHHPFTDVGDGNAIKQGYALQDVHPYAILASKRPREGRQFPEQDGVLYPNPPEEVLPRKQGVPLQIHLQPSQLPPAKLQLQAAHYHDDPYDLIAKNYAFSYAVKDKHSGDDFSHSQAHNGDATRGQYRVKLPDGRVQVVSYTADDKGYRADVSYEGAAAVYQPHAHPYGPSSPAPHTYGPSTPTPHAYGPSTPSPHAYGPSTPSPQHVYGPSTPEPHSYGLSTPQPHVHGPSTPSPEVYLHAAPQYVQSHPQQNYPHPSNGHYIQEYSSPYQHQGYSPSPAPYQHTGAPYQSLFSPTPTPYADYEQYRGPTGGYQQLVQYEPQYGTPAPPSHRFAPTPTPAEAQNIASPSPITFPTSAPEPQQQQSYRSPAYPTSAPGLQSFASPSPTPYEPSAYASATPTAYESSGPEFESQYLSATPSPFALQPSLRSSPAPFARHQNYVTSTEGPGHLLVTPRIQRNSNSEKSASRRIFGAREHVIYKFKSS